MKSGILKKIEKGLFIGMASAVGAGAVLAFGGMIGTSIAYNKAAYNNQIDALKADKTQIVYQMQEEELDNIEKAFEDGEYSFIEAAEKIAEVKSDRYVREKRNELLEADSEYQRIQDKLEERDQVFTSFGLGGASIVAVGGFGGLAAWSTVSRKRIEKEDEEEEASNKEDESETEA